MRGNRDQRMKIKRLLPFFSQGIAIGLVLGLLIVGGTLMVINKRPQIEFREAAPSDEVVPGAISYASAVEIAAPAVVNIHTTKTVRRQTPGFDDPVFRLFFEEFVPQERQQTNLGSGVIVN